MEVRLYITQRGLSVLSLLPVKKLRVAGIDVYKRQTYYNKGLGAVQWPFDIPFFLILNVAGGKGMAGPINEKHLPFTMQVDYCLLYTSRCV